MSPFFAISASPCVYESEPLQVIQKQKAIIIFRIAANRDVQPFHPEFVEGNPAKKKGREVKGESKFIYFENGISVRRKNRNRGNLNFAQTNKR